MFKPVSQILHSFLLLVLIGTFGSIVYYLKIPAAPGVAPTGTATPIATVPDTPAPETGWSLLQPGLERRVLQVHDAQNQLVESVHIWRLDQTYLRLDVAFDTSPKSLHDWQAETNATVVVNGGYFSIDENKRYSADGLTIVNGEASGISFDGFGGMLAIDRSKAELRWLVQEPYNSSEPLLAAMQSFPILVQPGGHLGFGAERENYARARRTVIGQDTKGRLLFIVTPEGHFTLHELSVYLTESDLDLDIAINLDGGGSTGILVANPEEIIPAKVLLPYVIVVYAR